jgi:NinB protein
MIIKSTGTVGLDGALRLHKRSEFDRLIKDFKGSDVTLTVTKRIKRRSDNQNAYYWGVVVADVRDRLIELGHKCTLDMAHEMLKARLNYEEWVNEKTGEVIKFPKSTADLSTEEFCEYIDKVIIFAREVLEISILLPNEQGELFEG